MGPLNSQKRRKSGRLRYVSEHVVKAVRSVEPKGGVDWDKVAKEYQVLSQEDNLRNPGNIRRCYKKITKNINEANNFSPIVEKEVNISKELENTSEISSLNESTAEESDSRENQVSALHDLLQHTRILSLISFCLLNKDLFGSLSTLHRQLSILLLLQMQIQTKVMEEWGAMNRESFPVEDD